MKTITRDELKAALDGGAPLTLLEALPEKHYRQGHLPGALLFPHDQARALAPQLLPEKQAAIVVYCASATCSNSDQAARALTDLGYTDVRVYAEGKADWQAAGLPLEPSAARSQA
jgi:rhodanese-related sulfurtransferase